MYPLAANSRSERRTVIDDSEKIDISYNGWISEPVIPWLKSDYTSTKKGELVQELLELLPSDVRYSKDAVSHAQKSYVENNLDSIKFIYTLEEGNFLGRANVASGVLPDSFLIPAIRDLNEETKTKTTTLFGRLLNRAMGEWPKQMKDLGK